MATPGRPRHHYTYAQSVGAELIVDTIYRHSSIER
jgi:hypothetical protein